MKFWGGQKLNRARRDDLKDGLKASVVERNCPVLSEKTAKLQKGNHNLNELAAILQQDQFERTVQFDIDYLKGKELPNVKLENRKNFLERLMSLKTLEPHQLEATKRVYRELFGKLPQLEATVQ